MGKVSGKLTAYFDESYWIGVFKRLEDGKRSVAKVMFGAAPKGATEFYKFTAAQLPMGAKSGVDTLS